jgi:hypothetical protein
MHFTRVAALEKMLRIAPFIDVSFKHLSIFARCENLLFVRERAFFVFRALVRRRRNAFNPVIIHLKNVVYHASARRAAELCIQFKSRAAAFDSIFVMMRTSCTQHSLTTQLGIGRMAQHGFSSSQTRSHKALACIYLRPLPLYPARAHTHTNILMWLGKWKNQIESSKGRAA